MEAAMIKQRLEKLRTAMKRYGYDAYMITSSDDHQSEYTAGHFKGRAYMSGFTGSAGTLLVTADGAWLWTDGRYFIQAAAQLDGSGITLMKQGVEGVPTLTEFISENIHGTLGFDGTTVSERYCEELRDKAPDAILAPEHDLLDEVWEDRPALEPTPVFELGTEYTGVTRDEKLSQLRSELDLGEEDVFAVSALDEIAWLLNIRASDVKYTPVVMAFLMLGRDSGTLFVNEEVIDEKLRAALNADGIEIKPYTDFYGALERKGSGSLIFDKATTSCAVRYHYEKGCTSEPVIKHITSPIVGMKAKKNETECSNIRKAHIIDGVAVTKLIYRLKKEYDGRHGELTEIGAADMLEELRKKGEGYLYQSFEPISAYGEHAAIVHYSADETSNARLDDKGFLLLDTGGQYVYGTTDITRTIALGALTHEQKQAYTAVLKGNLRLAAVRFKKGCTGTNLDIIARQPLWEQCYDYNHGTGHGVGYCLSVHEGPQGIRLRDREPAVFEEGMLTSDEPGVYLEGKFGIRLENLMLCVPAGEGFLRFETVTMVPFDRSAIAVDDLTYEDIQLLDSYHAKVYDAIAPYLDEDEREWLRAETALIEE